MTLSAAERAVIRQQFAEGRDLARGQAVALLDALEEAEQELARLRHVVAAAGVVMDAFDAAVTAEPLLGCQPGEADTPAVAALRALLLTLDASV